VAEVADSVDELNNTLVGDGGVGPGGTEKVAQFVRLLAGSEIRRHRVESCGSQFVEGGRWTCVVEESRWSCLPNEVYVP
jgi:hypothetical protein